MAIDELEGIATYIFKWNALSDACPRCQRLNGREFYDQDINQGVIWALGEGEIWNLDADYSMAHCKHARCNCRCQLAVRVECDWSKWKELKQVQKTLQNGGVKLDLTTEVYDLSPNISEARREIEELKQTMRDTSREARAYNSIMHTTLMLMSQSGIRNAADIRRMITLLYALQAAYRSVQLARMAAGDPLAWAGAVAEAVGVGVSVADMTGCFG